MSSELYSSSAIDLPILPDGWFWRSLSDLVLPSRGICYGIVQPGTHDPNGVPMVNTGDILDGQVESKVGFRVSQDLHNKFKRSTLRGGELLVTLVGANFGRVAIAPIEYAGHNCSRAVGVVPISDDAEYVMFALRTPLVRHLMNTWANTTAQPTFNLKDLGNLPIPMPPKAIKEAIRVLLKSFDDRIALLRETNTTLEAIAQALFKSWFVDFDPVHANAGTQAPSLPAELQALFPSRLVESPQGLIPEGWEWSTIGDVCEFQNGYAFKSNEMSKNSEDTFKIFKMGNIKKGGGLNRSGTKDFYEKSKAHSLGRYLIKKGDLLMCMTDMKNNVALLGHTALMDNSDEFLLNQRVGLLRTKNVNILSYPFLYILTNSAAFLDDLRARANSGVQVNLSTSEIKATSFLLPPKAIHAQFNELVEQLFESMFANDQKQECLIELRDTLLPRLISGQLRLPEAEAALAEVG